MDFSILTGIGLGLALCCIARLEYEAGRKAFGIAVGWAGALMLIVTALEFFTKG